MNRRLLLTVLLLVAAPAFVAACPPYRYSYPSYSYPSYVVEERRVVVDPIFVAQFIPVPVATVGAALPAPVVQAGLPALQAAAPPGVSAPASLPGGAPQAAAAVPPCEQQLAQLRLEMAELRRLIGAGQVGGYAGGGGGGAGTGANPAQAEATTRGGSASVLAVSCSSCHGRQADKWAVDDAGKVYHVFDDAGRLLDSAPAAKMMRLAYTGKMPPPPDDPYWKAHPNAPRVKPLTDQEVGQLIQELGGK